MLESGSGDDLEKIALLHLATPAGVAPFIVNDAVQLDLTDRMQVYGYGAVDPFTGDGGGIKRVGLQTIVALSGGLIESTGADYCYGDLGGPNVVEAANGFAIAVAWSVAGQADCAGSFYSLPIADKVAFIEAHVNDACFASAPAAAGCEGIFRSEFETIIR